MGLQRGSPLARSIYKERRGCGRNRFLPVQTLASAASKPLHETLAGRAVLAHRCTAFQPRTCGYRGGAAVGAVLIGWTRRRRSGCTTTSSTSTRTTLDRAAPTLLPLRCASSVPTFLGQCDRCSSCVSEHNNMCTAVPFDIGPGMRHDGTTRFRDAQGAPIHNFLAVSSFSEYTVVDDNQVAKLDPAMPAKVACLLSCGAGTGVGAAWKVAKVEPGSSVALFGLGSVGFAVAQGAKMCGASKIIGVDLNPVKEDVAKIFGVTDFVNPSQLGKSSVIEVIGEMTGGGVDYSFECIGVSSVMTDAFRSTKPGKGKTIILGLEKDSKPIYLPSLELLFGRCVMGTLFGGLKPKTEIPILAEKCMNKELELEGLVTHEVGLQDINKALDLLLQGKSLRCIIWMGK